MEAEDYFRLEEKKRKVRLKLNVGDCVSLINGHGNMVVSDVGTGEQAGLIRVVWLDANSQPVWETFPREVLKKLSA